MALRCVLCFNSTKAHAKLWDSSGALAAGDTEIMYFGLAPNFIGKGFGGYLLSQAIHSAWAIPNTKRVWVHTCSLDHASALANYKARGFKLYKEEEE